MIRYLTAMALVLASGAAGIALLHGLPKPPEPPNIVFILIDTLRYDRMDGQRDGHDIMPHLKGYAADGLNFTNTIAPCSWTRPTMASLFTGLDVEEHRVYYGAREEDGRWITDVLPERFTTPAEWLAGLGYQTFGVQANGNVRREFGFAQGFARDDYPFFNGGDGEWVADTALGGAWAMDEPFFLYAHFIDPHAPYGPPTPHLPPWRRVQDVDEEERAFLDGPEFMDFLVNWAHSTHGNEVARQVYGLSEGGMAHLIERYDADCHYADHHVARLVDRLRRDFPNTIFVITSDHGEEFFERGTLGHGLTLYEEQLRVPFLVLGPGIAPDTIDAPATLLDLFPTVAGAAGLPPLDVWKGFDLTTETPPHDRVRFSRTRGARASLGIDLAAAQEDTLKIIRDFEAGHEAVYDLEKDPGERGDLAESPPAATGSLRTRLDGHLVPTGKWGQPSRDSRALTDEQMEALDALGYLGDAPVQAPESATAPLTAEQLEALDALGYLGDAPVHLGNTAPLSP